ncbi:hypothetical protein [Salinisphaera orenii]|uniref:hypothetical protein n=1 Tax=Salinisphaera orenii TaxID=856731 RepID=UPI000DBE41E9
MCDQQDKTNVITRRLSWVAVALGLAGCLAGPAQAVGYLPGSGEMAQGPGVLSMGHYDKANNGGTVLFSTNDKQSALVHPGDITGDQSGSGATPGPNVAVKPSARQGTSAIGLGNRSPSSSRSDDEHQQFKSFQRFKRYQQYRHFKNLPADSSTRKKFRRWKKWQERHK